MQFPHSSSFSASKYIYTWLCPRPHVLVVSRKQQVPAHNGQHGHCYGTTQQSRAFVQGCTLLTYLTLYLRTSWPLPIVPEVLAPWNSHWCCTRIQTTDMTYWTKRTNHNHSIDVMVNRSRIQSSQCQHRQQMTGKHVRTDRRLLAHMHLSLWIQLQVCHLIQLHVEHPTGQAVANRPCTSRPMNNLYGCGDKSQSHIHTTSFLCWLSVLLGVEREVWQPYTWKMAQLDNWLPLTT